MPPKIVRKACVCAGQKRQLAFQHPLALAHCVQFPRQTLNLRRHTSATLSVLYGLEGKGSAICDGGQFASDLFEFFLDFRSNGSGSGLIATKPPDGGVVLEGKP